MRIEAELNDLKSGGEVWEDIDIGFSDLALTRLMKMVSVTEKLEQLYAATKESVGDLAASMKHGLEGSGTVVLNN